MDPFHQRLAHIGLQAGGPYGFALAGGYAIQALGMVERPSEDIDLFTAWELRSTFAEAVQAVVDAYAADGLDVHVDQHGDTFTRLYVSDGRDTAKVELAADFRANPPVHLAIGPVLHPHDAVANKMIALYGRAQARDFIDVDAAIISGQFDWDTLIQLAEQVDAGFDRHLFASALGQAAVLPDGDFGEYGMGGWQLAELRDRFAQWQSALLA